MDPPHAGEEAGTALLLCHHVDGQEAGRPAGPLVRLGEDHEQPPVPRIDPELEEVEEASVAWRNTDVAAQAQGADGVPVDRVVAGVGLAAAGGARKALPALGS